IAHIYCEEMFGVVGENVTFPGKRGEKVMDIRWTKDKHKVAEWEEQNKPNYFGQYHDRSVLMDDGSLTIINLMKADTGTYELSYLHFGADHHLDFQLEVFDSFPEPKISCNTSSDNLVLDCTADFQRPLNYTWKLSNGWSDWRQNLFISLEKVNRTMQATCIIKLAQIERSSEISLNQCFP
ncbi:LFA3 protein, partial [Grantiella picta]|nr:LFA3 protein [Grantiella picta]